MKKLVVAMISLPLLLLAAPAQASVPDCSTTTAVGDTCVMPSSEQGGVQSSGENLLASYVETVSALSADLSQANATIAERDATIYNLKAYYHSKLEVIGGRIEGYKDEIRWQRHEIKRLRAKVRELG